MISLVFNSSGLTPPMLTPLGDYFQNLGATLHSGEDVGEASLSSPPKNVGKDTLPSVGAESDQHVNICSFAVRCDRRWPSTQ